MQTTSLPIRSRRLDPNASLPVRSRRLIPPTSLPIRSRRLNHNAYNNRRTGGISSYTSIPTSRPRFDIREHKTFYELEGELPGIVKQDIFVSFVDPYTLVVRGRVKRDSIHVRGYMSQFRDVDDMAGSSGSYRLSGDGEDEGIHQVTQAQVPAKSKDRSRLLLSERCYGEFDRAFTFASRVDQDYVMARLEDGILRIVIPKANPPARTQPVFLNSNRIFVS